MQYFEDGIWDIYIGIMLLCFGLGMLFDIGYLAGIWAAVGITGVYQAKASFTYPRLGYVRFKNTKKYGMIGITLGVLLLGVVVALLFGMDESSLLIAWIRGNFHLVLALVWGGGFLAAAFLLNVPRFYLYAVGLTLFMIVAGWIGSIVINLTISGALISMIGIILLIRFIRQIPLEKIEGKS
jgi:hypothetical protein